VKEINSGIYCFDARKLFAALKRVKPTNKANNNGLTCRKFFWRWRKGKRLRSATREASGINTRAELSEFENLMRRNTIRN
jgi:bifunctional N-acetylglucosamine-1-phosphate-uridyltransferase/glucosamine-1-phosphate-acetyltransferase GlmU-like protein